MKFEDALAKMREGAKIRIRSMPENDYYMACYVSINPFLSDEEKETWEQTKARGQSIVWMRGDRMHPDMKPSLDLTVDACKHGWSPMINLLWLMSDEWEMI